MDLKDCELLITLYEEGSITKTSEKMYLSQPALTYRISQLEKEFNCTIILRNNKGVIFTTAGEYLVNFARNILKALVDVQNKISNLSKTIQGVLKIGVANIFAFYRLPTLLEGFLRRYPEVEVKLITEHSVEIMKLLQSQDLHMAIVRGEHAWTEGQVLLDEEAICVAAKDPIELECLPELNLINYQTDVQIIESFNEWWKANFNTSPNSSMHVDGMLTSKGLVRRGLGYSFFPEICIKDSKDLYVLPLEHKGKEFKRKTWLLYRDELSELKVFHAFIKYIRDLY